MELYLRSRYCQTAPTKRDRYRSLNCTQFRFMYSLDYVAQKTADLTMLAMLTFDANTTP